MQNTTGSFQVPRLALVSVDIEITIYLLHYSLTIYFILTLIVSVLSRHERNDDSFICWICKYTFAFKTQLDRHMASHKPGRDKVNFTCVLSLTIWLPYICYSVKSIVCWLANILDIFYRPNFLSLISTL